MSSPEQFSTFIDPSLNPTIYQNEAIFCLGIENPSKRLDIGILLQGNPEAWITINSRGLSSPGSTTSLYEQAQSVFQQAADFLGRNLTYQFRSKNQTMILWAKNKGASLFQWDSTDTADDGTFLARKMFSPQKIS
jgi:hypothetical protein